MKEYTNRLYADLAWLWPLWGDPEGYAPYCQNVIQLIHQHAQRKTKTLLNICCGGGKNIFNLKGNFKATGLDLSPGMLELAKKLNPECAFVQADMRNFCLNEKFDAILIDDGISYITNEADLRRVFERCFTHLEPGGVMIVGPDYTTETYIQNESHVTQASPKNKPGNIDVVFVENYYDPDPSDTICEGLILYIIRENGELRIEQDFHQLGIFPLATWRRLLPEAGFDIQETGYHEDDKDYVEFICIKPK